MTTLYDHRFISVTLPAGLLDLRETVLARSIERKPKWKFRLAPDVVLQLQAHPARTENVPIMTEDRRWELKRVSMTLLFEGVVLVCEGASAEHLVSTKGMTVPHMKQCFQIGTIANDAHVLIGRRWTGGYGAASSRAREEWKTFWEECSRRATDAFLTALQNGHFDDIGPAVMLTPNCLYCGKSLTDPASMARGIGPECAGTGSVHAPVMQNLTGGEDEAAPVPRRPFKLVLLDGPDPAAPLVEKVIRSMDDITLVPTPVTYSGGRDNKTWVEEKLRAKLFEGREKATIIAPSAMTGHPIITHCKVLLASVEGRPGGGSSPWWLTILFVYAGKQQRMMLQRDFPTDALLVAWGHYAINLTNLPGEDVHHHSRDVTMWAEVAHRFHAVVGHTALIDTTEGAAAHAHERRRPRQHSAA